ncbi:MAG: right-handed parallel beta-helix repeat-containing protein [Thermoplasmata archaeon]|nr:right-handed parallel beta-helix repeat-containing protein [Thermoplasmata archaeon]
MIDKSSNNNSVFSNSITQTIGAHNKGGVYVRDSYHNNVFSNDFRRNLAGVYIEGSFFTNVTENQFRDDWSGVFVSQNGSRSEKTNISGNTFLDEKMYSILLGHSFMILITSNNITSSSGRMGTGIRMGASSEWIDIRYNHITKKLIGVDAIAAENGYDIYKNNISDNVKGIQVFGSPIDNFVVAMVIRWNVMWENNYGICISHAKYIEVGNNSINASAYAGIYIESDSYINITHNWIENNTAKGIFLGGGYSRINYTNNIANNNIGIYLQLGATAAINNNNIFGNTAYGLKNWGPSTPDALWNWWGDSRGPYDDSDDGCCVLNTNTNGDRVLDDSSHAADYCGSGSDWLTAKI